ncbi:MAG: AGE family epimerase/isomerase, partial [Pedobacter sp.]|nr:AGE family epimerase/isomerase [Pedobacter sp.]
MNNQVIQGAALTTLERMALGGIYDQLGGGFARYSVDAQWHVPHFEKMLYDNAQLVSLYSEAYQYSGNVIFKEVAEETIQWLERDMTSPEGLFYSALDADSEGIEGKYYVWDLQEFEQILGEDAALMADYFTVTTAGNWEEEETNILLRRKTAADYAELNGIPLEELHVKISLAKEKLLEVRQKRIKPGLDDKCLTAWNAMMIKALAESSSVFENESYYLSAKMAADFILSDLTTEKGGLYRNYKNGKASITAFLDDYAFFIAALIALYEVDFDENWLSEAKKLTEYVLTNFRDLDSPMLFYTAANGEKLIARKHEIMDNVIPSANSVMAQNLKHLG